MTAGRPEPASAFREKATPRGSTGRAATVGGPARGDHL